MCLTSDDALKEAVSVCQLLIRQILAHFLKNEANETNNEANEANDEAYVARNVACNAFYLSPLPE